MQVTVQVTEISRPYMIASVKEKAEQTLEQLFLSHCFYPSNPQLATRHLPCWAAAYLPLASVCLEMSPPKIAARSLLRHK